MLRIQQPRSGFLLNNTLNVIFIIYYCYKLYHIAYLQNIWSIRHVLHVTILWYICILKKKVYMHKCEQDIFLKKLFFCDPKKKEWHTALEQLQSE